MSRRGAFFFRSSAVSISVVALVASLSPAALAEEAAVTGKAAVAFSERRAAEAFQAYSRSDYAAAVALYLEAYEAAPNGSILYNVARIYDTKLADRALAINFYRRYIADPGGHPDLIVIANQRLHELRDAQLALANPPDERATAAAGTKPRVGGSPSAARDGSQERRDGWSAGRWAGVAIGAVGVAGIGVGGGFGLAARSKANTAKGLCNGNACTSQVGVDAALAARTDATISNIGFAGGAALLATGVAVFVLGGDRENEPGSRAGIQVETWATASAGSLQVSGRW